MTDQTTPAAADSAPADTPKVDTPKVDTPKAATQADQKRSAPNRALRPRRVRRRRMTWQTIRAAVASLVVLAVTGAIAYYGADKFTAGAIEVPVGEVVALDAQSAVQVCPAPVSLPDGATSSDDRFGSTPVQTANVLQVAAFGAATTTTVTALTPADAEQPETSATAAPTDLDSPRATPTASTTASATASTTLDDDGAIPSPEPTATGPAPIAVVAGADPVAIANVPALDSGHTLSSVSNAAGSVTGAAAFVTTAGDLRGIAAATCQLPGTEQWLVGGSTVLGTSTRLVMQNPTRTPATVTVTVWGPGGELVLAGANTYLVPPGAQVSTLLEGLAAQQRGIVVHTASTGALTTAYLQTNVLAGFTPKGVDFVLAGAEPGMGQVLSGVLVENSKMGDPDSAILRLLAPEFDGTATITVLGKDGQQVLRGAQRTALKAGAVVDVSLAGLPAAAYSIVVQADVPVVAGAMIKATGTPDPAVQVATGKPEDRAWIASAHARDGGNRTLAVANRGATLTITALPADIAAATDLPTLVPIVYGDLAADTPTPLPTDTPTEPPTDPIDWPTAPRGTVEVYGTDGAKLGSQDLVLATGQTATLDLRTFGDGAAIGAIRVIPVSAAAGSPAVVLDWAVVLSDPEVSGSIAVQLPSAPADGRDTVTVRRSPTVGLAND